MVKYFSKVKGLLQWNPLVFNTYKAYLTSHNNIITKCFNLGLNATYVLYKKIRRQNLKNVESVNFSKKLNLPKTVRLSSSNLVLIVAELSIPQCNQYRVYSKCNYLKELGFEYKVISWRDFDEAIDSLQLANLVIFYRVPFTKEISDLYTEAERLSIPKIYDIDDLIFHPKLYSDYLETLNFSVNIKKELLNGSVMYKKALCNADYCIISTRKLEEICRGLGKNAAILPNGITDELEKVPFSEKILKDNSEIVRIFYGAGSNTHDEDINSIAKVLCDVLEENENVELFLLGDLNFSNIDDSLIQRIHKIPRLNTEEYYTLISTMDIAVIPLTYSIFTECKSNIKLIEASWFMIPSVVCNLPEFTTIIEDGKNGFVAKTIQDWYLKISILIKNPRLRKSMGEKARQLVLDNYDQKVLANRFENILTESFELLGTKKIPHKKILTVNIYWGVSSFGGATVVAEGLAETFSAVGGVESYAFATHYDPNDMLGGLRRYSWNGVTVFSVNVPLNTEQLEDDLVTKAFIRVIDTIAPNVVHLHAVQGIGDGIAGVCITRGIDFYVTLHDFSWLCPRLFLTKRDGNRCGQCTPNFQGCHETCGYSYEMLLKKRKLAIQCFSKAKAIYVPSIYMQHFVQRNWSLDNVFVNRNGIEIKKIEKTMKPRNEIHFGFVAGKHLVKGYGVIREVFNNLGLSNWVLHIIYGGDPQNIKKDFAGAEDKVVIEEPIPHDKMPSFYNMIDVLLFPSLMYETFGLTVREAILCDCFVIVSDCGGPSEAVNSINGVIVERGSTESLKQAVENVLSHADSFSVYRTKDHGDICTVEQQAEQLLIAYNNPCRS